jgi:hypothetical protein
MLPDYPHKLFSDKRRHFELLMETLAMDIPLPLTGNNEVHSFGDENSECTSPEEAILIGMLTKASA